jgi:hypothetical protein
MTPSKRNETNTISYDHYLNIAIDTHYEEDEHEAFLEAVEEFRTENEEQIDADFMLHMVDEGESDAYSVWFTCHLKKAIMPVIKQDPTAYGLFKKARNMYNDFCEKQFKEGAYQ